MWVVIYTIFNNHVTLRAPDIVEELSSSVHCYFENSFSLCWEIRSAFENDTAFLTTRLQWGNGYQVASRITPNLLSETSGGFMDQEIEIDR